MVIPHIDDRLDAQVRALTADRAVVLTEGTIAPVEFVSTLNIRDFDGLIDETTAHQTRISQAISDYMVRTRNKNLVQPEFPSKPLFNAAEKDEPALRALSVADYIARAWMAWLESDEQRVRRATDPRSGAKPWIMPEELGNPTLAVFPREFAASVKPEPLV